MIHSLQQFLKRRIGLDRAIGASTLTQLMRFVTGPITMVLMIRHFSPAEQGFYYSFAGVLGLQVFLEAGFAQSIIQFTSREFANLRFNSKGYLSGSPAALSRLRSLISQANRYYRSMAVVISLALAIGGYFFFSSKPSHSVPWVLPWFVACASAGIGFLITPFWAFLEGCNRVAQVATYRMWSTFGMFLVTATGLMLDFGIYVVAWGAFFNLAFPILYLGTRWRRLLFQVLRPPGNETISWRKEVWGFQWRIAGTWMSRYFLETGIAPLAFHLSGPAVAGQVGMTLQVTRLLAQVGNNWTALKIPMWGAMIASNKIKEFNDSWHAAATRSVCIRFMGLASAWAALFLFALIMPDAAKRFLPPSASAGFIIGLALYSFFLISSHYTRAMRQEPFLFLHLALAISFLVLSIALTKPLGNQAIPWAFAAVHLPAAFVALRVRKSMSLKPEPTTP